LIFILKNKIFESKYVSRGNQYKKSKSPGVQQRYNLISFRSRRRWWGGRCQHTLYCKNGNLRYDKTDQYRISEKMRKAGTNVAYPECLSRILIFSIPDPGSRILDPTTATKEVGEKLLSYLFCGHKYHKI
jgi:hypothetical protein